LFFLLLSSSLGSFEEILKEPKKRKAKKEKSVRQKDRPAAEVEPAGNLEKFLFAPNLILRKIG
jgi:hypothetical protein